MNRLPLTLAALVLFVAPTLVHAQGPYYARGNFYCSASLGGTPLPDTCWGWGDANRLYDDGLHDDGAAGDGIWGGSVTVNQPGGRLEWKIATNDWSESYPNASCCALTNAVLFTTGPGDVVHFRLDTAFEGLGWWPPRSVSCDHAMPPGTRLEIIGSAPEIGSWLVGVPAFHVDKRWQRVITIATPGVYEFKLRALGTWDVVAFGWSYNNTSGDNALFETRIPNTDVLFQFDETTGRVRAIELGPTPTRPSSWGALKSLYR